MQQQEIAEAASIAAANFEKQHPNKDNWTRQEIHDFVNKAVAKTKTALESELRKQLPICAKKYDGKFLEQVKIHYELFDPPEMRLEKLWSMATSAMNIPTKLLWLERWNRSPRSREDLKFPKLPFNDDQFNLFLHKATFWSQVSDISFLYIKFQFSFKHF